jgi:hypothetical protein
VLCRKANDKLTWNASDELRVFRRQSRPSLHSCGMPHLLTAVSASAPATASASAISLFGLIAVLAIYRPVASRLKRHSGLLAASGTRNRRALRFTPVVSSAASTSAALLVLLRLAARLTALWRRVTAFLKKRLIFAGKRELLPTIGAS